jgi:hypothetical protein
LKCKTAAHKWLFYVHLELNISFLTIEIGAFGESPVPCYPLGTIGTLPRAYEGTEGRKKYK